MLDRPIAEVLDHRPCPSVLRDASVRNAARLMQEHQTGAVLVVDDHDALLGICSERDIVTSVVASARDPARVQVSEVMTTEPESLSEDKPFSHALHLMYEGRFRHVPVVDAQGRAIGILSPRDALGCDAREFEQQLVSREEITVIL